MAGTSAGAKKGWATRGKGATKAARKAVKDKWSMKTLTDYNKSVEGKGVTFGRKRNFATIPIVNYKRPKSLPRK